PAGVHRHVRVGLEDAQRDPRVAVVEAAPDPLAVHADDVHQAAGPGALLGLLDQLLEDPGMAGLPSVAKTDDGECRAHPRILRPAPAPCRPRLTPPPRPHTMAGEGE